MSEHLEPTGTSEHSSRASGVSTCGEIRPSQQVNTPAVAVGGSRLWRVLYLYKKSIEEKGYWADRGERLCSDEQQKKDSTPPRHAELTRS